MRRVCYLDRADIAETMVRNGFARDCPRFSDWRYREADFIAAREGAKVALEYKPLPYCLSR